MVVFHSSLRLDMVLYGLVPHTHPQIQELIECGSGKADRQTDLQCEFRLFRDE